MRAIVHGYRSFRPVRAIVRGYRSFRPMRAIVRGYGSFRAARVIVRGYGSYRPMRVFMCSVRVEPLHVMWIVVPMIAIRVVDGRMPVLVSRDGAQIIAASIDFLATVAVRVEVAMPPSVRPHDPDIRTAADVYNVAVTRGCDIDVVVVGNHFFVHDGPCHDYRRAGRRRCRRRHDDGCAGRLRSLPPSAGDTRRE
ncbi:hypothetical protein [Paraburkholderia fungorum]|uniref:hypothetical protein n=1 Tax=Paraburkholderia fungorum TaxID=134537 RepID=UPI0038B6D63B